MGLPQMMGMPVGMPMGAGAPVVTRVRERTGLGFTFDTIRIPLPIIRPIAIPRPTEVTMQFPVQPQATGFAGMGFAGAVPMGGVATGIPFGGVATGVPFGGVATGVPLGLSAGVPLSPQALALAGGVAGGAGQAAAQGQFTPQQLALLQLLLAQAARGSNASASSADGASASAKTTSDQQIEELLNKCEELKRLKRMKEEAEKKKQSPPSPAPGTSSSTPPARATTSRFSTPDDGWSVASPRSAVR
jgi:hypothetical protein